MTIKFNFNRLRNVYISTLNSYDKAVAFDIQVGKGKFLFMMYLSDEDEKIKILSSYICGIRMFYAS